MARIPTISAAWSVRRIAYLNRPRPRPWPRFVRWTASRPRTNTGIGSGMLRRTRPAALDRERLGGSAMGHKATIPCWKFARASNCETLAPVLVPFTLSGTREIMPLALISSPLQPTGSGARRLAPLLRRSVGLTFLIVRPIGRSALSAKGLRFEDLSRQRMIGQPLIIEGMMAYGSR